MIPTWQKRNGNSFVKQDSTPKCRIMPSPRSKLHQMKYIAVDPTSDGGKDLIAASTEDGRVIFYSTEKLQQAEDDPDSSIPFAGTVAQLGGKAAGLPGRVKDFEIFNLKEVPAAKKNGFLVVTGNSDGAVRVWMVDEKDLTGQQGPDSKDGTPQVGRLLNTYETGNRITCLKGFVMLASEDPSTLEDSEAEEEEEEKESDEESSDDSD